MHVSQKLFESYEVEPELSREYLSASLFRQEPGGLLDSQLARFQAWVTERITQAVSLGALPKIDPLLAFIGFFSLYFGYLVAGLQGRLERNAQLTLLDASLRRLFLQENKS